jgi:predicted Zn-dependent protease with MMP-like domain
LPQATDKAKSRIAAGGRPDCHLAGHRISAGLQDITDRIQQAMNWNELRRIAQETVEQTRAGLPAEIRALAAKLPVSLEAFPEGPMLADENVEPDILGLFVGPSHIREISSQAEIPPQILLFLENLWDESEGDPARYREEIRITYLHELGHYLGWDEEDIGQRGLA